MRSWIAILLVALQPMGVAAQLRTTLVLEPPGKIDNLVPVTAHQARCVALSDVHNVLAFGHDKTYPDAHVSLVKLDGKGNPAASATVVKLPRLDSLAKFPSYTLGVALHPKVPLLYVWQDITLNYTNPVPPQPPDWEKYDHLHIFSLAKEPPELLASLCRGGEYMFGQSGGALAVDAEGGFLYVPNLREVKNAGSLRFGRFALDAEGLPVVPEVDAKLPAAARGKRLTDLNAARPVTPTQLTPIEYLNVFNLAGHGCGLSFYPIGKDTVIAGSPHGLVAWRPDDKIATIQAVPLKIAGHTLIAGHPALPMMFATSLHPSSGDSFFRVSQVEGYLSLLPQQYVLPATRLSGQPVIMSKRNKVALGGQYFVYVVNLDDKGVPVGGVASMQVLSPGGRALVYSEKHDRLYVGVELSK